DVVVARTFGDSQDGMIVLVRDALDLVLDLAREGFCGGVRHDPMYWKIRARRNFSRLPRGECLVSTRGLAQRAALTRLHPARASAAAIAAITPAAASACTQKSNADRSTVRIIIRFLRRGPA